MASVARPRYSGTSAASLESTEPKAYQQKPSPYASVPALIDLYQQVPAQGGRLLRFGASVFENGSGNFDELPMDVPVGPDYVIGPGDGINVEMWGSVSQRLQRVVDREGRLSLPEIGTVQVAGKSLAEVQQAVQSDLRAEFRDVQADVSLARLRTVRVYVVGDVANPGAYDVSSLSTPLNALYAAGGPTARGSMRLLKHYRAKQLIENVDIYDLLLHGVTGDLKRLEAGDTIMVPPARAQVALEGMVRRPAFYELSQEQSLEEVLELAGGVLPSGALRHIQVERIQAHENRVMLSLDLPESDSQDQVTAALAGFKVQDGDRIRVFPILPYAEKSVYLDGHVYRPGKYAYHQGMKISDLIRSYSDMLPEPSRRHAELIRLSAPDFRPMVVAFNIDEALKGDPNSDLLLQPLDTVRIFGRYDFEDPPEIQVTGEVRNPGQHQTNGDLHVRDAVYLAGGLAPDAMLSDAQIFHRENGQITVKSINLSLALKGDAANDILLHPRDLLIIHRDITKTDPPSVMVEGDVVSPGKYPLGSAMTASELVRLAGGFRRGAYTDLADLSRYTVHDGARVLGEHQQIEIAKAFTSPDADVPLRDGDVLTIRELAGFKDIGATVAVQGQVMHPSTYGIKEGERLSSVLKRAGGFAPDSYPQGIVLSRVALREMEEKNREDMLKRIQSEISSQKYKPGTNQAEVAVAQQSSFLQEEQIVDRFKNEPPVGRLVVHISSDISKWQNTPEDVELRKGDTVIIPKRPTQIMVTGQVFNPTSITYIPGKSAGWYLRQAGGASELANKKSIFVVRADGSVIGHGGTIDEFWHESVLSAVLHPGDTIVVPERLLGGTPIFKTLLDSAQIASSIAISAKAVGVF
jgi:protein involved in polysaccharide export with SLBB domain